LIKELKKKITEKYSSMGRHANICVCVYVCITHDICPKEENDRERKR
jgi:hypothetical protein